jgi:hypothetical protein
MNQAKNLMKKGSTIFLKVALVVIGLIVLALCIFGLPAIWKGASAEFPMAGNAIFLIMIGLYATTAPFFIALWQMFTLLNYIDQNKAFSDLSVKALRSIKRCATIIAILYIAGVPLLFPIAEADDAPGLLLIGMVIAAAPAVVAVFAAVLERLLQNAIEMKKEFELTV